MLPEHNAEWVRTMSDNARESGNSYENGTERERRRNDDTVIDMMREHIGKVEVGLNTHIEHCSAQQRWILRGLIGLCGWVVLHSPEVLALAGKAAVVIKP